MRANNGPLGQYPKTRRGFSGLLIAASCVSSLAWRDNLEAIVADDYFEADESRSIVTAITMGAVWSGPLINSIDWMVSVRFGFTLTMRTC